MCSAKRGGGDLYLAGVLQVVKIRYKVWFL